MNAALEDLIQQMEENDVEEMIIDEGEKKLILDEIKQIKIVARKKSKDGLWEDVKG
jgi:hypothetical protein